MATSDSEIWSTLGYHALSYFWGIPIDEVDRLAEADKRRLTALTNKVTKMPETQRSQIVTRLESVPQESLIPALQELASELLA